MVSFYSEVRSSRHYECLGNREKPAVDGGGIISKILMVNNTDTSRKVLADVLKLFQLRENMRAHGCIRLKVLNRQLEVNTFICIHDIRCRKSGTNLYVRLKPTNYHNNRWIFTGSMFFKRNRVFKGKFFRLLHLSLFCKSLIVERIYMREAMFFQINSSHFEPKYNAFFHAWLKLI